jgi:hypothetical protein
LEALEERHPNIAVITLPADSGIMDISAYKNTTPQHSYQNVKNDFLMIAMQDPRATQTFKDFYISPRIRALLFQDESGHYSQQTEIDKLNALLHKSFAAMAIPPSSQLSNATRQAVWFHCIKYELTHYIIETLSTGPHGVRNPLTVNFSCKDGIDRGGIASAYYHLIRSFELSSQPMNREEFDEALHAASTMVKARGMNYHLQVIWNAVNTYVNSHYERLQQHHEHKWLVTWRDENCPHVRIKELLKIRVQQLCSEVGQAANTNNPAPIQRALQILSLIQTQIDIDTSGKRLLLQAAVNTTELLHHPSTENLQRYTRLAEAIVVHYPTLKILSGLMKALVGAILYVLSLGIHKQTLSTGVSTFHSGWYAQEKYVLHSAMKSHLLLFSPARLVLHHPPVAENAWLETNDVNGIREMPVTQRSAL